MKMTNRKNMVLVVDDDAPHRMMLKTLVSEWGYDISEADDGAAAIELAKERAFDLILMDIRMVKVSGIEALDVIKAYNPAIPIIIMTAYSSVETAVKALKKGAYDYLTKPLDFDKLKITIKRAMEHTQLKVENKLLKQNLGQHFDRQNIIGTSTEMTRLLETIAQVAPSEATILINGDSGTGKELVAGAIHFNSARKKGPFVKINCAAITETLLESELFGHEKGAFTGANKRTDGRFLQANLGTLFLDEVSEMSLTMQVKLLRVLQEREITRVGGDQNIKVDVRIIAASNKKLDQLIDEGKFREDLYYRLNVVGIDIPPLKDRPEDIPLLAQHYLNKFGEKNRKSLKGFTPNAMDKLMKHNWPGNVRELMNAVERAVVLSRSDFLDESDLPFVDSPLTLSSDKGESREIETPSASLEEIERNAILKTLESAEGNKSETARRLGITRKTLHKKLKKYGKMP